MPGERVIALSADKALGKQIATALQAAGAAVESHAELRELGQGDLAAALLVLHLDGELSTAAAELVPRLTGDTRVIAIVPRSNLAAVVDVMLASERISGVLVAEGLDVRQLTAMASRALVADPFGLDKVMPWGTQLHSQLVGDYQEKSLCIAQVSGFAEGMGVRRKYREMIEQCLDEMLMNALYDAPVDEHGKPLFAEVDVKTRISLRVDQKAIVSYACDGKQFALSVRDAFGRLERATVLRYLHKCLHAEQQIDRKAGGAGLGLYMMVSSASTVLFHVQPGVATEAVCVFDLESHGHRLAQLGYFTAKPEPRMPVAAPAPPRYLVTLLVLAILATCALIAYALVAG